MNCWNIPTGQPAAKPHKRKVQRLSERSRVLGLRHSKRTKVAVHTYIDYTTQYKGIRYEKSTRYRKAKARFTR